MTTDARLRGLVGRAVYLVDLAALADTSGGEYEPLCLACGEHNNKHATSCLAARWSREAATLLAQPDVPREPSVIMLVEFAAHAAKIWKESDGQEQPGTWIAEQIRERAREVLDFYAVREPSDAAIEAAVQTEAQEHGGLQWSRNRQHGVVAAMLRAAYAIDFAGPTPDRVPPASEEPK